MRALRHPVLGTQQRGLSSTSTSPAGSSAMSHRRASGPWSQSTPNQFKGCWHTSICTDLLRKFSKRMSLRTVPSVSLHRNPTHAPTYNPNPDHAIVTPRSQTHSRPHSQLNATTFARFLSAITSSPPQSRLPKTTFAIVIPMLPPALPG